MNDRQDTASSARHVGEQPHGLVLVTRIECGDRLVDTTSGVSAASARAKCTRDNSPPESVSAARFEAVQLACPDRALHRFTVFLRQATKGCAICEPPDETMARTG